MPLPTSTPSAQGVDALGILALVDALESDGHDPHSLLVARHGHVGARGWWAPYAPERVQLDSSLSKSFTATAVGLLVDEGRLSLEQPVLDLLPPGDLPAQREMAVGSMRGLQLVVADAAAARAELVGRGVECSEVTVFDERDGGTFFGFADPDGNTWAVQQLKARGDKPLIPVEHRGRFGAS